MAVLDSAADTEKKFVAGSREVRPTRSQAEESETQFWRLFGYFRDKLRLTNEQVGAAIGYSTKNTAINISPRISNQTFTAAERGNFLSYIFRSKQRHQTEVAAVPDALYFALLHHCHAVETSQDNARIRLAGTYKLWRFSVEHESEFVLGRIDIEEDDNTHALKVRMIQPKQPRDGLRGTRETASGYMFRLSNMYVLLLTDDLTDDLRVTIFPRSKMDEVGTDINKNSLYAGRHDHVVHLDGFGLGVDGSTGFFSPVHLSFVDDVDVLSSLDDSLDVAPAEDETRIPKRILEKLRRSGPLRRL
ncbi:MAG: hypothetical protein P4M09_06005 [Devosia sp.]|nr:hypothetical protein [Devosia sp.]